MSEPQDPNSITPPWPGATDPAADSIVPPWPIRLAQQLRSISEELGQLSASSREAAAVKADVDSAIARLSSIRSSE